jgi:hypothetical protein
MGKPALITFKDFKYTIPPLTTPGDGSRAAVALPCAPCRCRLGDGRMVRRFEKRPAAHPPIRRGGTSKHDRTVASRSPLKGCFCSDEDMASDKPQRDLCARPRGVIWGGTRCTRRHAGRSMPAVSVLDPEDDADTLGGRYGFQTMSTTMSRSNRETIPEPAAMAA